MRPCEGEAVTRSSERECGKAVWASSDADLSEKHGLKSKTKAQANSVKIGKIIAMRGRSAQEPHLRAGSQAVSQRWEAVFRANRLGKQRLP